LVSTGCSSIRSRPDKLCKDSSVVRLVAAHVDVS
jgi:hypothetical protein